MTNDSRNVPYSKGFILAKHNLEYTAHFKKQELPSGWKLWTDEATHTEIAVSKADNFVVIRGHWVDTADDATSDKTAQQLLTAIETGGELALHRRTAELGGRFVLIVKVGGKLWVYNDATGMRSVYYSLTATIVASHLHLLAEIQAETPTYLYKAALRAMDETPYVGIRQILPNFRLNAVERSTERFFPFEKNRFVSFTSQERFAHVEKIWRRVIEHYLKATNKLALSITGGLDSKLMLAMCRDDSAHFDAYTYGMTKGNDSRSESLNFDITQVKSILPHVTLKSHTFLDITTPEPVPNDLNATISANTWGSHGRYLVPLYRELFTTDGWHHLRGNGVEIVRRFWPNTATDLPRLLKPLQNSEGPSIEKRAQELGYDKYQFGYDLTDLLYWEVRMGKWHSEIINEQDAAFETFLPMSVRDIIELLLAFPEKERENAAAIYELINRNNPILNFWGANDERNLYERWRDEVCAIRGRPDKAESSSSNVLVPQSSNTAAEFVLYLAKEEFYPGNSNESLLYTAETAGALSFVIDQPYRKKSGEDYFEWHVKLNGHSKLKCDGAVTMTPTTVTIWNIPKNTRVEVALVALKRGPKDSDSWERASRLSVRSLNFYKGHINGDGELSVTSDNPYAVTI